MDREKGTGIGNIKIKHILVILIPWFQKRGENIPGHNFNVKHSTSGKRMPKKGKISL